MENIFGYNCLVNQTKLWIQSQQKGKQKTNWELSTRDMGGFNPLE